MTRPKRKHKGREGNVIFPVKGGPKPGTKAKIPKPDRAPLIPNKVKDKEDDPKKRSGSGSKPGRRRPGGSGLERTARRLTNGVIRDEVRDLSRQRREINRAAGNANRTAETQYQRGIGDLNHIFGEVTDFNSAQSAQTQQMFDATKVEQSAAAAALQQQLGNIYGSSQAGATSELDRLGLGGSQFMGQLASDQANAQAVGAIGGSNTQANLGLAQQNAGQLSGILGGMASGSLMSNMGKNLNTRNDALTDIRQERADQQQAVREAIRDARGSRRDVFFELLQQLQQTGWAPHKNPAVKNRGGPKNKKLPKKNK